MSEYRKETIPINKESGAGGMAVVAAVLHTNCHSLLIPD